MTFQTKTELIQTLLQNQFNPTYLMVINESDQHHTHGTQDTHYQVTMVSDHFVNQPRVKRHQAVYHCLKSIMSQIHALSLHLFTQDEWQTQSTQDLSSPRCLGGFNES